jgi:hypothetical protein
MTYSFEKAAFHPWVGDAYENSHFGLKLLIMGESHYRWPNQPKDETTITREALKNNRHKGRFFPGLERLVPVPKNVKSLRGWDAVAFYNYVQHFVGDEPRDRPTDDMWSSALTVESFKEVLAVCKPDRVLVVGKTNWRMMAGKDEFPENPPILESLFRLPESFCAGLNADSEQNAYWYPTGADSWALCAPIFHTAYPKGFHSDGTEEVMTQLLSTKWKGPNPKR